MGNLKSDDPVEVNILVIISPRKRLFSLLLSDCSKWVLVAEVFEDFSFVKDQREIYEVLLPLNSILFL
jgi:hypothetical protein